MNKQQPLSISVLKALAVIQPDAAIFQVALRSLNRRFNTYSATTPQPLPAPGLVVTHEIRLQSELYLPIAEIRRLFYRFYSNCLEYPPIFSSTPFNACLSWADCFVGLPSWLQLSPNPAILLERLLENEQLLIRFLFYSFLPVRFNGSGFGRYPDQFVWLQQRLSDASYKGRLRVLDAACGSGEGTWELVELFVKAGLHPEQVAVEGWTLEPLEVFAASRQLLPHDRKRQQLYQKRIEPLLENGWQDSVIFKSVDLLAETHRDHNFDLIVCNGLIGGPIVHHHQQMKQVVDLLSGLLLHGGVLLMANHFHDGWKKLVPDNMLASMLAGQGLSVQQAGEGVAAIAGEINQAFSVCHQQEH